MALTLLASALSACSSSSRELDPDDAKASGGAASGGSAGAANGGSGGEPVCIQDLSVPLGVNIIENGGFEEGDTGWQMEPWPGAVASLTGDAHSGSAAVEIQGGLNKTIAAPLTCGIRYTLRAWAKKPLSHENWAGFGIDFRDANGEEVGEMSIEFPASDDYKQVSTSKVTPPGTVTASLWVWGDGRDGLLYLDDVELVGTAPPSSTGGAGGAGGAAAGGSAGAASGGAGGSGGADGGAGGSAGGGGVSGG
jgi:hypothetical protein